MESAYLKEFGADWLTRVAAEGKHAEWRDRLAGERVKARNRGEAQPSEHLLDYANLYELLDIAERHWGPLCKALGKHRSFSSLLGHLEQLRDGIAHSRQLLPFQRDLAAGIAGYIRNKVTIFLSTQDEHGEYFTRMESARDSFGNEVSGPMQEDGSLGGCHTELTLRADQDVVQFQCTGWDAQGRDLRWEVIARSRVVGEGVGNEVTLSWAVDTADVGGGDCTVQIRMWPEGAEYHRYPEGVSDSRAFFYYTVLPPV
jgi:hypothetical protein